MSGYSQCIVTGFKNGEKPRVELPVCHSTKGSIASTRATAAETFKGTEVKQSYASCASIVGVADGAVASAAEALRLTTAQGLPVSLPHLCCKEANALWAKIVPVRRVESFIIEKTFSNIKRKILKKRYWKKERKLRRLFIYPLSLENRPMISRYHLFWLALSSFISGQEVRNANGGSWELLA